MYGAGEFGDPFQLEAANTLSGIAMGQGEVVIATIVQAPTPPDDEESPEPEPGGDGSGGAEKTGAWPQKDKLDLVRLDAARQIQTGWVPSGFAFHEKLSGWKPETSKPRQSELWQAIMERDPSQKPKHWDVKKCVMWLMQSRALPAAISPGLGPPDPALAEQGPEEDSVVTRWSTPKMMRLLHVCLSDQHFQEFLQRDKKLTRAQLDAKARNSFWHAAAITFCDASKTFDLMDFPGVDSDRYSSLKAGLLPTTYALTAEKAKKEFGDFRTLLTKIYQRFKVSGEGDNVDEEKMAQEIQEGAPKPHGADFWDFCQGNAIIDYAYRFLKKKDALQNATCLMPTGSTFNSTPGGAVETNAAKPRPNRKRKGGPVYDLSGVLRELRRPVKLHQSRASKALELIQAQRQALKLESGLRKLARQLAEEESKIQRELRACAADSQPASLLQARLTPIQKRLGSLHAQLATLQIPSALDIEDDSDKEDVENENGKNNEDDEEEEDEEEGEEEDGEAESG